MKTIPELEKELLDARRRQPAAIEAEIAARRQAQQVQQASAARQQAESIAAGYAREKDRLKAEADAAAQVIIQTVTPLLRNYGRLVGRHNEATAILLTSLHELGAVHRTRLETLGNVSAARRVLSGIQSASLSMSPVGDYGSLMLTGPENAVNLINIILNSLGD